MVNYPHTVIDWTALTHVTVAFAYPTSPANLQYQGGNLDSAMAKQITALAHAHGRKAILMIGGVGSNSDLSSAVKYGANAPSTFVNNIYNLAHADGFDGVDIDWESLDSQYHTDFKNLAVALRIKWPGMTLTCALGWGITDDIFFGTLKDSQGNWLFDQFNVMRYDAANSWPGWQSWFHNALDDVTSVRPSSIAASLTDLAAAGVPKDRIGCGIPFYGSAWTQADAANHWVTGPRQSIASGSSGSMASQGMDTVWTYKYILDHYAMPYDPGTGIGRRFDEAAGASYFSGPQGGYGSDHVSFLRFDDAESIAAKRGIGSRRTATEERSFGSSTKGRRTLRGRIHCLMQSSSPSSSR